MQQLAAAIRHDIDRLVDRYEAGLHDRPGYDRLPEALRRDLERRVLTLIADSLEAGDHTALTQYVQQRAVQWETLGFPLGWFQQALIIPEEILTPLISSVEAGNFLWQALNRSQGVVWQMAADRAHQTEERFRSIIETSHSGILITDDTFHLTYVNDELLTISGYTREELLGDDFRHLLDEESRRIVADHYVRRQRGEDIPPRYEVAFVHKSGAKRYIEMSAVVLKDLNGKPYTVAQVLDVSERKQTEQALRASQQLLQSVMDNIPQAVFWKDQDLRYLGCNQAFVEDAGLATPQHIVGKTDYDMPWAAQAEAYRVDDRLVMELGAAKINYEEPQTTPTGETTWLRTSKVPMRDAAGNVTAVLGMYEDITERREAEETLAHERNLLRTLIDTLPDQVFVKDTQGRLMLYNQADATAMRLNSTEEALGKTVYDFYPRELADTYFADDMAVIESDRPLIGREERGLTEDGQERWVLTTKVPLKDQAGRQLGLVGIARDITERKRLEDQIRESLARRGAQVQTSVEVAQEIAAAPDLSELFTRVVTLIKERFNYYHAQIFRYDPAIDAIVLVTGYGAVGQDMLADGHRLPMGQGVVGTAASTGQSILAADVAQDADWRPNPHLPETRGELAVPIKLRDEVLGILDVQSNRAGALTNDDRLLLEGLCGQIASAMESTRLLEQLRQNERQLNEALKIAQLANWEYDVATDTFTFSDQFYALLRTTAAREGGYTMSSAQYAQRFVHPDDAPLVGREVQLSIETTDPNFSREIDHRIFYADGELGYFTVRFRIEKDAQGRTVKTYGANQDITERQRIEEVLRQNEAQLSEALKIAKLGYWEYDVEKDLFLFNDQFYSIFHTTAEQAGGYQISSAQYAQQFVYPDDLPIVGGEIEQALNSTDRHYTRQLEHRVLYADGGVGHISVNINIDRDEHGKILRYYGANQDITERQLAEEETRRAQRFLDSIIENIPIMLFVKDARDLRFVRWNKAGEEVAGFPRADMIGKNDLDFFPTEEAEQFMAADRQVLASKQPIDVPEEQLQTRFQGIRTLHTRKIPILDEQGNPQYLLGISEDITERQQAEQRLQELLEKVQQSEQLMRTLIDAMPDHIYAKDVDGRLILANRAEARLHGVGTPEALIGKSDFDFYPPELAERYRASEQPILRDGIPLLDHEEPNQDATGRSFWSSTTKVPLRNQQGQIVGLVGKTTDITTRKQAEAERERLLREQQRRAIQLQTAAEVSRAASSIFKTDELLSQVADLVRDRFNFYYVGVFLIDAHEHWAVLQAGTGEAGRQMLANGHKLKINGNSMISQCIVARQARIALDVGEEAVRFDNPLLPLTRSEMALPLISRGRVIGAATIQSDQAAAFTVEDVAVLQSMADQIGNAVENARLFEQAQTALQEVDAINRQLTGEAWHIYLRQQVGREVIWLADDEAAAPDALPELDAALTAGKITIEPDPEDETEATVTAPILLRGQPIGALRLRTPLNEWDEDNEVMLADIASHIAQAVENARLVEQTQRTAQRERTINEINARVRQSVDLDAILRTAVNELGQSLKAARVTARVGTTATEGAPAAGDGRGRTND